MVVNLLVITLRNAVEGVVTTEENIVYKIDFYLFDGIIFYSMGRLGSSSSASKFFPSNFFGWDYWYRYGIKSGPKTSR